jgi:hypothetical protein
MTTSIRELPRTDLPRPAVYATAVVCGVLTAIVVQIILGHAGVELSDVWRNLLSGQSLQLRSAGPWWAMAGAAFLMGAVVAAALSRLPLPWLSFRLIRWILGAAIVFALAEVGHMSGETAGEHADGAHVGLTFGALISAGLTALFGAYFAAKR